MPTAYQVTKGLVLRVTDTKETDKILTVLTPDMGKISVIATDDAGHAVDFAVIGE